MFELRPYRNNNHMTTYDPFRDMEALERAFFGNRDFLGDVGTFKTDIQDKGDHYLLEADLPGMKKEDIAIDIDGDNLTIKAERRNEHEEKDKSYVRCERSYGSYARSFDISGIKAEGIKASYNDGVLSLTLPDGTEISDDAQYAVAAWAGSIDESYIGSILEAHADVGTNVDLMTAYLDRVGEVSPAKDGRITLIWD